jgi:hypothetical protein
VAGQVGWLRLAAWAREPGLHHVPWGGDSWSQPQEGQQVLRKDVSGHTVRNWTEVLDLGAGGGRKLR